MKKYFYLAVAACAALAACSKNEVTPVDVDQEITFQTVVNKASSRAMIDDTTYPTSINFGSYAYYYTGTYPDAASKYINKAEVKHDGNSKWLTNPAYYWPKMGKLAFYSFSPYSIASAVECSTTDGIKIIDYDVDAHQTDDVMVADFQEDKTANESYAGYSGVPTLFRHKLAQVVSFKIKTYADYATGTVDSPAVGDKFFFLNAIKIGNIAHQGTFTSGQKPSATVKGSWTKAASKKDYNWCTGKSTEFGDSFVNIQTDLTNSYLLVLPQEMTAKGSGSVTDVEYVELDYTIRTHWGAGSSEYSEDVVKYYVDLKTVTGSWDINKKYTYEITVALDQILWAPQVVEWETDNDSIAVNS